jgi:glutamate formiminotransferase/formiminotetrahydrofolate cyclodeaminase
MENQDLQLIECVPNISEGRDMKVIEALTKSIQQVAGVYLLHRDIGYDANRTVFTFIGESKAVGEAAFNLVKTASELIDMRMHRGIHPRIGAADVIPFIPVANSTMDDAIVLAHYISKRIGEELKIPVYCYEYAALSDDRRPLENCRSGNYEGLLIKMANPLWKPDFGPDIFNPLYGATIVGARDILIAYNINLKTTSVEKAKVIASIIRESGQAKFANNDLTELHYLHRMQAVKAIGWFVEKYGKAQISMNLTNFQITPVHIAFETVKNVASAMNIEVSGSEIVGLVPFKAVEDAGAYFAAKSKLILSTSQEKVQYAIDALGLNEIQPFHADEKIIEYRLKSLRGS